MTWSYCPTYPHLDFPISFVEIKLPENSTICCGFCGQIILCRSRRIVKRSFLSLSRVFGNESLFKLFYSLLSIRFPRPIGREKRRNFGRKQLGRGRESWIEENDNNKAINASWLMWFLSVVLFVFS